MSEDDDEPRELPPLFIRKRMKLAKPPFTGKVLAEKMGTSEAQVSRLLGGKRKMSLGWLYAFSKAMDVPIAELFTDPKSQSHTITKDQIQAVLAMVEGASPRRIELAYLALTGEPIAPTPLQPVADDQSAPAKSRRVSGTS